MALEMQAKILRVLQDRIVVPIGGRRQTRVDVRILAATHQDLERMAREGRFREDLYYRLRELEIVLPPLRDRREDLRGLATRFLTEVAEELGYAEVLALSPEAELASRPTTGAATSASCGTCSRALRCAASVAAHARRS
jgi:transcriptional regulator with PAS, ATPase and Fis domain